MIHIHKINLLCIHQILKRKTSTLLLIPSLKFQNQQFYKKKTFSKKKFKYVFKKNTNQFCGWKYSDLHLRKMHTSFVTKKNI